MAAWFGIHMEQVRWLSTFMSSIYIIIYISLTISPTGEGGEKHLPPHSEIANYAIFSLGNMFLYHLAFIITGNLPFGPLRIFKNDPT